MKDKIILTIKNEDKRKPYTDEQLADVLNLKREQVTVLRQQAGLSDSRERRKPFVIEKLKAILQDKARISERDLTCMLKDCGFDISRFAIRQYRQELENKLPQFNVIKQGSEKKPKSTDDCNRNKLVSNNEDVFSYLVGHQGSLKPLIEQAKAAVFYPPKGLHTLILGEPGVGKSDLAEGMYNFAKSVNRISASVPFVFFNCADYVNNPQLLMAQLFGYVKGSFTGAEADKEGLVEKANKGILFLDEVHRLPPEGQEILFYIMDKGVFRRLGESEMIRRADIMIIAATTEDPESSLLVTFRRRIPMVIEIPSLSSRPMSERYKLVVEFFNKEATRTKTPIEITSETIRALLLFDCPGNIGQLLSVIQVSCARSFLNYVINQDDVIRITVDDLPTYAKKGLLKIKNRREVESLINGKLVIYPDDEPIRELKQEALYSLPSEIYQYIEQRHQELQNQNMGDEVINYIIGGELEIRFKTMIKNIGTNARPLIKSDLVKIVGNQVFHITEKMLKIVESKMNITGEKLFYCLAIHLRTTLDRLAEGKMIINPHLQAIKKEYTWEYEVAREMVALAEVTLDITLPEDETGFIAMYLANFANKEEAREEEKIGIVLISHGHVAEGMAEVANRLLGVVHAKSVEMSLDESPENALNRAIETVKDADEGKGVLLLVDMGSLVTFGELIAQKTGIKTRVISRVDTVKVIEAVRKAFFQGIHLDELADSLEEKPRYVSRLSKKVSQGKMKKPKVLVTVCVTGEGTAIKIKELIENVIPEIKEQLEIITLGVLRGDIRKIICDIGKTKEVVAVVGSVNPALDNIIFIPIEDIVKGLGIARIKALLEGCDLKNKEEHFQKVEETLLLQDLLAPNLMLLYPKVRTKDEVIQKMGQLLVTQGYVKPDYVEGVYQLEQLRPTFVGHQAAMPHADPSYVLRPGVAIAKLLHPVDWDGHEVSMVYMLALCSSSHGAIKEIYKLITSKSFFNSLDNVQNEIEFFSTVSKCLQ